MPSDPVIPSVRSVGLFRITGANTGCVETLVAAVGIGIRIGVA
ncbi:MAG: hypothetical protein AAF328_05210 [Planctomycetota bacterium]